MSLIERAVRHANGLLPTPATPSPQAGARPPDVSDGMAPAASPQADPAASSDRPVIDIDCAALSARGFVTPDGPPARLSQELRVIKRPLMNNAFGKTGRIRHGMRVMVTSSLPGEGKSFCAINLALSIAAERDHSVLLVDADVAKPSVPRELGVPDRPGLLDWLLEPGRDVGEFISPTSVERLSLLTAGRRHEHATELLASESMTRLLEQLSARYPDRIMIFDSPPLLLTTESRVLASHMGQIVMVVEAGQTSRETVAEALSTIKSCEVVGMVLNKYRAIGRNATHAYGGYGYGAQTA